ncbi:unnamed protein product [Prunus armeniaca]
MDQSLLAATLSFWSSSTYTMNLRFDMMTPTVLDMAALFGLSPLGMEVNAALVAPEAVGSFNAAWPTLTRLAGSKAKNKLNYSSFYNNFGANKVTLEFAHLADYLAQGGRLALGPFLLGHIYRTLHDVVTDGMKPKHGGPLWAFQFWLQAFFPELRGATTIADTEPLANALAKAPRKHNTTVFYFNFFYELTERTGSQFRVCLARPYPLFLAHNLSVIPDGETENDMREIWGSFRVTRDLHCGLCRGRSLFAALRGAAIRSDSDDPTLPSVNEPALVLEGRCLPEPWRGWDLLPASERDDLSYPEAVEASKCVRRRWKEATRGALKNADWDPFPPKSGKGKKASAALSRPSAPAAVVSRVTALSTAKVTAVASTATPSSRATIVVGP